MNPRRRRNLRLQLRRQHGDNCHYCGVEMDFCEQHNGKPDYATLDRIRPGAADGEYHEHNLVLACQQCNGERGDMPADEFRKLKRAGVVAT